MATITDTPANAKGDADLKGLIQAKKAQLEAQIKALDSANIEKLIAERDQLLTKLTDVEARIAEVRRNLGLAEPKRGRVAGRAAGEGPRRRMSSLEVRNRVMKALSEQKHGLSQKDISERTAIPYGTVAAYLKNNLGNFKTTGQLKGKRYFLK